MTKKQDAILGFSNAAAMILTLFMGWVFEFLIIVGVQGLVLSFYFMPIFIKSVFTSIKSGHFGVLTISCLFSIPMISLFLFGGGGCIWLSKSFFNSESSIISSVFFQ